MCLQPVTPTLHPSAADRWPLAWKLRPTCGQTPGLRPSALRVSVAPAPCSQLCACAWALVVPWSWHGCAIAKRKHCARQAAATSRLHASLRICAAYVTLSEIFEGEARKRSRAAGRSYPRARETPPEAAEARLLAGAAQRACCGHAGSRAARTNPRLLAPQAAAKSPEGAGSEAGTSTT